MTKEFAARRASHKKSTTVMPAYYIVMPAKAGIQKLLISNTNNKLTSGLRRNDDYLGQQ